LSDYRLKIKTRFLREKKIYYSVKFGFISIEEKFGVEIIPYKKLITFFIKDIAKYLRENPEIAGKIPGKISELVPCPITNDEFSFLKTKYRQQVSESEEKEIE